MRQLYLNENSVQEIQKKIDAQPWLKKAYEEMIRYCDEELLNLPDDYLEERHGASARKIGAKSAALYTAYLLTGKESYLTKAIRVYEVALDYDLDFYYSLNKHLSMGDATLCMAITYDFLYDHLDEVQREKAEKLTWELANWLHTDDCAWGLPHSMVSSCNHNCVHYGALGVAGMVFDNEEWLAHGKERVDAFLEHCMDKTGYITEGLGYAGYGLHTGILFCEAYKKYTGVQLLDIPNTMNLFMAHCLPELGKTLRIGDDRNGGSMLAPMYLMSRYKNAAGLYLVNQFEEHRGDYFSTRSDDMMSSFVYPFLFLFANETLDLKTPIEANLPLTNIFECGRVMTRSAWEDPMAYYLAITSGENHHYGHNHADKGCFSIHALGEEFYIDPGKETREGRGHNIMQINGVDQRFGDSRAEMLKVEDTKDSLYVVCDTMEAYDYNADALLAISRRNFFYVKGETPFLVIRDDMQTEKTIEVESFFEFMMHTAPGNDIIVKDNYMEITGKNHKNTCRTSFVYPEHVDVKISDEVRNFYNYGKEICATNCFKEAIASCTSYNPFLTTVITFAKAGEPQPVIITTGSVHDMTITVEQNGEKKSVHVSRFEIKQI